MIRRPIEPSTWWAWAALWVGLLAGVSIWAYQFGGHKIWILDNGREMRLGWDNATLCLYPWTALRCRYIFSDSGFSDLATITRFQMTVFVPVIMGIVVLVLGLNARHGRRPKVVVLEGPAVSDFEALKEATIRETKDKANSLPLFGGWSIPPLRQSLGIMLIGAPGSGKTNFLRYLFEALSERGDRMVIYGHKPNVYAYMPPVKPTDHCSETDPILINPADHRSWIWDIAKDIDGEASCVSVARRLVLGKDDFWTRAATSIITVMLVKLHRTKRHQWTWADLFNECNRTKAEHVEDAKVYYPDALKNIAVQDKQYEGVTGTLANELQNLKLLALAWPSYDKKQTISARQFLHGTRYPRTLVVGFSADYPEMSEAWITIFMSFVSRTVFQTDYKVSKDNRTWVILDELDKLKKVDGIDTLVSAGREQGVSVVLGLQDVSQIEKVYGSNATDLWMTSMQTKVIGRMEAGNSARWLMESLGKTRVRTIDWKPGEKNVLEWKDEDRYALRENDLNHEFGIVEDKGAWMGVLGVGRDHHRVFIPFKDRVYHRPEYEAAKWILKDKEGTDLLA